MTDEHLRYPIGKFEVPLTYTPEDIRNWIKIIDELPGKLRIAVGQLTVQQLDTPYREGGWTIRQVIHHIADSHMNAFIRFNWTLTEDNPTIKAYLEAEWARQPDHQMPVEPSLKILEGLHQRLVKLLSSFTDKELNRTFIHPQTNDTISLKRLIALYAWHSRHHLAHVTETVKKFG